MSPRPAAILLLLLGLLLGAPHPVALAGPTVQVRWRLLALGVDTPADLDAPGLLSGLERALARELPGLEVRFDRAAWRRYPAPPGAPLGHEALAAWACTQAQREGLAPADYDAVFVLAPGFPEPWFGEAHLPWRDARGRPARLAVIRTDPMPLVLDGILASLDGRAAAPDFSTPAAPPPALARALRAVVALARPALLAWGRRPLLRDAMVAATLAHELGHFFAPGDPDVRDGYQAPWLRHATGPDDNPEGHGPECCLSKGRDLGFWLRKAAAHLRRGRAVLFCDACRRRLGLVERRRGTRPEWSGQ